MLELYQFPISHFCEKVRWALEYKDLKYQKHNLVPLFHMAQVRRHCGTSSVPVLKHGHRYVQDSAEIITYLDEQFPQNSLTPSKTSEKQEAAEWEAFADREIGPHIRRVCYHVLLDHPEIVVPFFTHECAWHMRLAVKTSYKGIAFLMRKGMNITDVKSAASEQRLRNALETVNEHLKGREYMIGKKFSRADLALASLLAPFVMPDGYGLDWPKEMPDPLKQTISSFQEDLIWTQETYRKHRLRAHS